MTFFSAITIVGLSAFFSAFLVRLYFLAGSKHTGPDAYYFLLSREIFRKNKKIPITHPGYHIMENPEQWYPPGFTIFLSLFSDAVLQKYYWLITPVIDSLINVFWGIFVYWASQDVWFSLVSVFIYAVSSSAYAETRYLTSRQLGSFFFHLTIFTSLTLLGKTYDQYESIYMFALLLFSGYLLLLTHKFSTQSFFAGYFILSFFNTGFLWHLAAIIVFTVIFTKGYYLKVLFSHFDYIRFWSRYWPNLYSHQVYESPIYGKKDFKKQGVYQRGSKWTLLFIALYAIQNFYIVLPFLTLKILNNPGHEIYRFSAILAIAITLWGLCTFIIPFLRGFGFVTQYGKYTLILSIFSAIPVFKESVHILTYSIPIYYFLVLVILANLLNLFRDLYKFSKTKSGIYSKNQETLDLTMDFIKSLSKPVIMCVPNHYCDMIAYFCRTKVLFGGHSSPADGMLPILPVIREPLEDIVKKWGISHILIDKKYASLTDLKSQVKTKSVWNKNEIEIFQVSVKK